MKNQWIHFFSGMVKVSLKGRGIERFINQLIRHQILVWNVKKHGDESITCYILLKDIPKIRQIIRNSGCKLSFLEKKGLPFLIKKAIQNSGFFIGIILFFIVITLLSNMVWGIEIKGANPETEHKIMKELEKMGIKKGKLQFFIRDVDSIQKELTDKIDEITWVGVVLNGTTYEFEVVEKNLPEPAKKLSPRNLVAKKEAIITSMFVEEGQALVKINDYVKKGQVLVSGEIGSEENKKQVPAQGEIFGETWYKSDVEVPLNSIFHVLTGDFRERYFLSIGHFQIPIYGFKKIEFKEYEIEKDIKKIRFLKWTLPIAIQVNTFREKEVVTRNYTKQQAFQAAKKIAKQELLHKLPQKATIKGEKVLHQGIDNGKVKLSIHYQVIEEITTVQPIIQGD